MIRIAVVGTRPPDRKREPDFEQACRDYELVQADVAKVLLARFRRGRFTIVTGGANGVDKLAEGFAWKHGLPCIVIEPNYRVSGSRDAPLIRNGVIENESDAMLAWPKRRPGGTDNAIGWMRRAIAEGRKAPEMLVVRRPWKT